MCVVKNARLNALGFSLSCLFCRRNGACVLWVQLRVVPFFISMDRICSFFGHRDVFCDLSNELYKAIETAITEYSITTFYVGDRGNFDRQASGAVLAMKQKYEQIRLVLVLPYFTNKLNEYKEIYESQYDEIIIPSILDGVHPKGAITKRNRWMVNESELIISYITREFGGAYDTVKYASKRNKRIINIGKYTHQS